MLVYCRYYYKCNSTAFNNEILAEACQEPTPFFDYRRMRCGTEEETLCYPGSTREIPSVDPNMRI